MTIKAASQREALGSIERLLATVKAAEAKSEVAETTHPIKSVDDHLSEGTTGARDAEYKADMKEQQGVLSTDAATEPPAGGQEAVSEGEGVGPIKPKSTGQEPEVEDDYKAGYEDPGSSHEARVDNDALDGRKYSSEIDLFRALVKKSEAIGTSLLAELTAQSREQPAQKSAATQPAPQKPAVVKAAQAGSDLAGVFADYEIPETEKAACDEMVFAQVEAIVKQASDDADAYAQFMQGRYAQLRKQAEEGAAHEGAESPEQEAAEQEAAAAGAGGEGAPTDQGMPSEEELLQLLMSMGAGGGEGGGAPGMGAMGGDPAAAGGGDPAMAAAGGDPAAAGAGEGGDMALLQQVLQELGANPQEVKMAFVRRKQASSNVKLSKQQLAKKRAMSEMVRDMIRR